MSSAEMQESPEKNATVHPIMNTINSPDLFDSENDPEAINESQPSPSKFETTKKSEESETETQEVLENVGNESGAETLPISNKTEIKDESSVDMIDIDKDHSDNKEDIPETKPEELLETIKDRERKQPDPVTNEKENNSASNRVDDDIYNRDLFDIRIRCPEKIIICLDLSDEMENTFSMADGTKVTMFKLVRKVIRLFLHTKQMLCADHEFALVIFQEDALMISEFTKNVNKILSEFQDFSVSKCSKFNMSTLFECITQMLPMEANSSEKIIYPPPFIVRTILIYGRSKYIPSFDDDCQFFKRLIDIETFYFDVLFLHDLTVQEQISQEIYDFFCDLDKNYLSYIFEVSGNATKLHNYMAMLLAHPFQRPIQHDTQYKLKLEHLEKPPTEEEILEFESAI